MSFIKHGKRKLYIKVGALAVFFFVHTLAGADLEESKRAFEEAEKTFYSANQSDCIPLFETLTKRLVAETTTRTLVAEEHSLLERSFDYLAQIYFDQNDLANAKASLVKLLEINPEYQMNEDLVSVKVISLFNETKKESLSRLSVITKPSEADVFLDGRLIGNSDLQSYAVRGEHSIEVKKPGYLPYKIQITVAPPDPAIVQIELQEDPAGMQLYQDAKSFLDAGDVKNAQVALEKANENEKALSIVRSQQEAHQIGDIYLALAGILRSQGDLSTAVGSYEQAIALYEKGGDKKSTANVLSKLAELYALKGDPAQSKKNYEAALSIYRDLKDPVGSAEVILQLGNLALQENRLSDARTHFEEARSLFEQTGDQKNLELLDRKITQIRGEWKSNAVDLLLQGYQLMNDRQYEKAEQKYQEALDAAKSGADKSSQVGALLSLGFLTYQRRDIPTAKNLWEEALTLSREIGEKENEALALYDLSTIYYTLRDYARAEDFYKQSEQLYQSMKMEPRKRPWESQK